MHHNLNVQYMCNLLLYQTDHYPAALARMKILFKKVIVSSAQYVQCSDAVCTIEQDYVLQQNNVTYRQARD